MQRGRDVVDTKSWEGDVICTGGGYMYVYILGFSAEVSRVESKRE